MKVALVHELLTMKGGAERVLRIVANMFPDAPIYTLLYDEKKLSEWFPKERIKMSSIQPDNWLPIAGNRFNHHRYLTQFPRAVEAWDFSDYDLVISFSSAFAHGIITNGKPKHLCYVHSPARYLWDRTHDVVERASRGPLGALKKFYLESTFHKLRQWDAEVAPRPDMLLAASNEVQRRIQLYWNRQSTVIHPPIDNAWFANETRNQKPETRNFIIVSTLVDYKRIDRAITACNELKLPLTIVGEGPAKDTLQKMAGPTIAFAGYKDHDELRSLYSNATATIIPGEEDFGLVALESMACGTPVIAYGKGGVLETVVHGVTGAYFDAKNPENLTKILHEFDPKKYSHQKCREQAEKFRQSAFEQKMHASIKTLMKSGL